MVTNKTQNLFVTSGTGATDVDALGVGEFAVISKEGSQITVLEKDDVFRIVTGKLNGSPKYSDFLKASGITSVSLQPYRASQEQEVTVVFDTPVEGLNYNLSVINNSDKEVLQRRQDKRSYGYRGKSGETDGSAIASAIAALINADQASVVTATVSGSTLTLTAKSTAGKVDAAGLEVPQYYFEVFLYEEDANGSFNPSGTLTTAQVVDFGSGSYTQVKTIEQTAQGNEGYFNRTQFPVVQYPSDLNPAETYDLLVIEGINIYSSNSVSWGLVNDPISVVIAVEAGNTTDLEAVFANFL